MSYDLIEIYLLHMCSNFMYGSEMVPIYVHYVNDLLV